MRTYEAACIFRANEEGFVQAKEEMIGILKELGAESPSEQDLGVRTLAYPIQKEIQGHYIVFEFAMEAEKAQAVNERVQYFTNLLRILVTRKNTKD